LYQTTYQIYSISLMFLGSLTLSRLFLSSHNQAHPKKKEGQIEFLQSPWQIKQLLF
jgi:hypothetical protein